MDNNHCIIEDEDLGLRINKIITNNITLPFSLIQMHPGYIVGADIAKEELNKIYGLKREIEK